MYTFPLFRILYLLYHYICIFILFTCLLVYLVDTRIPRYPANERIIVVSLATETSYQCDLCQLSP